MKNDMKATNIGVKINVVACHFGICASSLKAHLNGKAKSWKHEKDGTLFAKEEEEEVVHWVLKM